MDFTKVFKQSERIVEANATAILTGIGVVGTVTTAVLTGRASFKAAEVIENNREAELVSGVLKGDYTVMEKTKLVWPLYLPAVGCGVTTITAIIFANRISSKRAAALAAAYGLSEKSFREYKEKALQHLGVKKETALRDEVAQDTVNMHPVSQTIIIGDGDVLCFDAPSGRYFRSNVEKIRAAENKVNHDIIHHHSASLGSFYDEIDLPGTSYSDSVGWNVDNLISLTMHSVLTDENKPCLVIDFKVAPITGYGKIEY